MEKPEKAQSRVKKQRQLLAKFRWLDYGERTSKIGVSANLIHASNMMNLAVAPIALFFSGTPLARTDVGYLMFAALVSSLWSLEQSVYFVHIRLLICMCVYLAFGYFSFMYASYREHVFIGHKLSSMVDIFRSLKEHPWIRGKLLFLALLVCLVQVMQHLRDTGKERFLS